MAQRFLEGPSLSKGQSLKGNLQIDTTRGVLRVRAWPKKRGKPKALATKIATQGFADAMRLIKRLEPGIQEMSYRVSKGTPFLPRDIVLMMITGRLARLIAPDGTKIYPVVFMETVSDALDTFSQEIGCIIVRGKDFWQALEPPAAPGLLGIADADGLPAWTPMGALFDNVTTEPGSMFFRTSDGWIGVPGGTAGQVPVFVDNDTPPKWTDPAAGGGGTSIGGGSLNYANITSFPTNFYRCSVLPVPFHATADRVHFWAKTAAPTAQASPCIYRVREDGVLTDLLATGPTLTGAVAGRNVLPLTAALEMQEGDTVAVGMIVTVAGISMPATMANAGAQCAMTRPPPAIAPATSSFNNGLNNFELPLSPL